MSKKTEQAVVRAAMRWVRSYHSYTYPQAWERPADVSLAKACAAHAKSKKGKRK